MRTVRVSEDVLVRLLRRIEALEELTGELLASSGDEDESEAPRASLPPSNAPRLRLVPHDPHLLVFDP